MTTLRLVSWTASHTLVRPVSIWNRWHAHSSWSSRMESMNLMASDPEDGSYFSPARNSPHNQKRFAPRDDGFRQSGVGTVMRNVLFARKEPEVRTPPSRAMLPDRSSKHRVPGFEGVQQRADRC